MHSENRMADGPLSARGRPGRGNMEANNLTLFDLPQDLQHSGHHSYASTGPTSRDELQCYSRDSRFGHSPAYSQCPSPVNTGREWMQHPPLGPNNHWDNSQDPQYKSNTPLKSPSHFVPEDYINGHRRSSLPDIHDQMAFDQGQQLTDGNIYQVSSPDKYFQICISLHGALTSASLTHCPSPLRSNLNAAIAASSSHTTSPFPLNLESLLWLRLIEERI